jgi:SAM-dependent methyltransferase
MDKTDKLNINESTIKTTEIDCLLCNSKRKKTYLTTDNLRRNTKRFFDVAECTDCGFRYTAYPPTLTSMKYYYPDNYYSLVPEKINLLEIFYYSLFRSIPTKEKGTLLDIGCGNGKFLYFMKKRGWEVHGQDLSDVPEYLKKDIMIYSDEVYNLNIRDSFFDVITLWASLEHMRDPLRSLEKCSKLLKKGGIIVIFTSNSDSFEAKLFGRYWHHLCVPEHYSQFTEKTLRMMAVKAGFKILKVRHDPITFGFINSFKHYLRGKNIEINISNIFTKTLFLPVDIISSVLNRSGLITLYATKR